MRGLATVRVIEEVRSIEGADNIDAFRVGGWWVVGRKGEFFEGDRVVYCEVDSWIPHTLAPFLSRGSEPREYKGIKGERLRTVKLRGQLSQGLILPIDVLSNSKYYCIGEDVSEELGIVKWDAPVPAILSGNTKGVFPSFIPRTRQERVQNLSMEDIKGEWFITEKLDGSSCTIYLNQGEFGVCSRNLELKEDESNTFWKVAKQYNLEERMKELGYSELALQGELVGEGVQGNPYKVVGHKFYLFDVYNIEGCEYLPFDMVMAIGKSLRIPVVPLTTLGAAILPFTYVSVDDILLSVEGLKSKVCPEAMAEGVVFKSVKNLDGKHPLKSFKVISNSWLLNRG